MKQAVHMAVQYSCIHSPNVIPHNMCLNSRANQAPNDTVRWPENVDILSTCHKGVTSLWQSPCTGTINLNRSGSLLICDFTACEE